MKKHVMFEYTPILMRKTMCFKILFQWAILKPTLHQIKKGKIWLIDFIDGLSPTGNILVIKQKIELLTQ